MTQESTNSSSRRARRLLGLFLLFLLPLGLGSCHAIVHGILLSRHGAHCGAHVFHHGGTHGHGGHHALRHHRR